MKAKVAAVVPEPTKTLPSLIAGCPTPLSKAQCSRPWWPCRGYFSRSWVLLVNLLLSGAMEDAGRTLNK